MAKLDDVTITTAGIVGVNEPAMWRVPVNPVAPDNAQQREVLLVDVQGRALVVGCNCAKRDRAA